MYLHLLILIQQRKRNNRKYSSNKCYDKISLDCSKKKTNIRKRSRDVNFRNQSTENSLNNIKQSMTDYVKSCKKQKIEAEIRIEKFNNN